jgi:hypothetical protein
MDARISETLIGKGLWDPVTNHHGEAKYERG